MLCLVNLIMFYKENFHFLESIWDPKGPRLGRNGKNVLPILSHVENKIDMFFYFLFFLTQIAQNAIKKN